MQDLNTLLEDFTWDNFQGIAQALTSIDRNSLESEMSSLPVHYSYYHALMSRAKTFLDNDHKELAHMSAQLSRECQTTSAQSGKKATAKDMENFVHTNSLYLDQLTTITTAQERYMMLKGLVHALELKKDMLVQLNANNRAETKLYS